MRFRTILLFAVAALLAGCFKDVSFRTTYVLKPLVQPKSTSPYEPLTEVKAFAYSVDTTDWTVASYADALQGVITAKYISGQTAGPAAVAEPYVQEGTEGWVQMPLEGESMMILAVDTKNRLYAYTQQIFVENLPQMIVTLPFRLWKEGKVYKDGKWTFFSEFYIPPVKLKCNITPRIQATVGGEETDPQTTPTQQIKAYAYAVDTTQWYITSYDDALGGKITSKTDPKQVLVLPNYEAFAEGSGVYSMSVTDPQLMVVVVDKINKIYAYSKQEVVLEGDPVTFPKVVFRPWSLTWILLEEGGWRVVNEKHKPKNPDPETPQTFRRR